MTNRRYVPVVGLVGGVGSGKSAVARTVADRMPVLVIDGDKAGHDVLNRPEIKEKIRQRFGNTVFDAKQNVDRPVLGRVVFGTSDEQIQARSDLEHIVHPGIRDSFNTHIAQSRAGGTVDAIVLDAAVLLEAGWHDLCDAVVFVDVPRDQRLARVTSNRGWSEQQFQNREQSQWPLEQKREAADYVVDNQGRLEDAADQFEQIIRDLIEHHS